MSRRSQGIFAVLLTQDSFGFLVKIDIYLPTHLPLDNILLFRICCLDAEQKLHYCLSLFAVSKRYFQSTS